MKRKQTLCSVLAVIVALFLISVAGGSAFGQTPEATNASATTEAAAETPKSADTEEGGVLEGVVIERTPLPTATPSPIQEGVSELTTRVGLDDVTLLGLRAEDWINLTISLLIVLAGYFAGTWVIRRLLPRLARRSPTDFDDRLLAVVGPDIRWMVVLIVVGFAVDRLIFISLEFKTILRDLIFIAELLVILRIVWLLLRFAEEWFSERAVQAGRAEELAPIIKLMAILGRVSVIVIGVSILLSHFGVDVTLFMATLGLTGLALSLGARDLIADLLAGITILVDQPFRIGNRIEVQSIDTWGDVMDIGLRSTRIRTLDNRMVTVPNSTIASNEVINYSYPDPVYRYETHVSIAYGSDVERARRIIIDNVRQLDEVLSDRPVDALYVEMGDSAMIFRVRWWMESYVDTLLVLDKVHTNIQAAFDTVGIVIAFPQQDVHVQVGPETLTTLSNVAKSKRDDDHEK